MKEKKYVVDTSALIEKAITELVKQKKIKGTVLIPHAVIAELENQANRGLEIGFLGLEEIQEMRNYKEIKIQFIGDRPNESQIKLAKSGEIDALIREIAYKEKAILITGDLVQSESGKAFGLEVIHLERKEPKEKLEIEKYFDNNTMSVHLKEDSYACAKKGKPGEWDLVKVDNKKSTKEEIEEMAKEVIEKSRIDPKTFVEISRRGSTIVQSRNYRVVIVKPPLSDGWEMTIVRPLKKVQLEEYKLPQTLFERMKSKAKGVIIAGEPGSGKCHGKNTSILMFDGSIKMVQDIESGDLIMGPDSKPRRVISTTNGYGKLYRITPVKGDSYIVNENHILSLKFNNHYNEKTVNIAVKEFINRSKHYKGRCRGYRTSIEFYEKPVPVDPYFLGVWLGDGISASLRVANSEPEILGFLDEYAEENGLVLKQHSYKTGICQTYALSSGKIGGIVTMLNPVLNKMRMLNLMNNKHIPDNYKINNRTIRLQVLAGLLDTDGSLQSGYFEITTKYKKLKEDILFLARSLGFATYSKEKFVKNKRYYRISLSGVIPLIPTRVKRKIGSERKQVKNVLRTGIKVKYEGMGEYYGFELSGDGLYCLGDFTVTHNSTIASAFAEFYLKQRKVVKTIESPRDLQLDDEITQYSKNFASHEEIHDILFLSRPDTIIFDEMRDTPDFQLYSDLRLAGSNVLGVLHSSSPIDAVQRFIIRLDIGLIPSILDTILFIEKGNIGKVLSIKMTVKVPTGMTESDLARPVVEVRDFETNELEYEIYSYGEQTVVVQAEEDTKYDGIKELAKKAIENELLKFCYECKIQLVGNNKAIINVPEKDIAKIIGKEGKTIGAIEKKLGISIDVQELKKEKKKIEYKVQEDNRHIRFYVEPGKQIEIYTNGKLILTCYSSRKGEIKIHKQSQVGREILNALLGKKNIEIRG